MKHKTRTKVLSWLLSLALMMSLIPGLSLTAQAEDTKVGTATYTITDGVLTVGSGTFTVAQFSLAFGSQKANIRRVFFEQGATMRTTKSSTKAEKIFAEWPVLESVDMTNLTANGFTSIHQMFYKCSALKSVLFGTGFDTSSVTTMSMVFSNCTSLTTLDISHFNTSKVTSMGSMFSSCSSLTSLDLSSFNTAKVTNMGSMFSNCGKLKTIYVSDGWNTDAVTTSTNMFSLDYALKGGSGTQYSGTSAKDKSRAHVDGGQSNPGYLTLKGHMHSFSYALSDDHTTITATCTGEGDCGLSDNRKVSIKITAPETLTTFASGTSGSPAILNRNLYRAPIEGAAAFNEATNHEVRDTWKDNTNNTDTRIYVQYYKIENSTETSLGTEPPCKEAGNYRAKITVENLTAYVDYTLTSGTTPETPTTYQLEAESSHCTVSFKVDGSDVTLTDNKANIAPDKKVIVSIIPETGYDPDPIIWYEGKEYKVTPSKIEGQDNAWEFTMPSTNIIVSAICRATISPTVSLTGWTYGQTANSPSVEGNTGNGTVTYAYKIKDADDSTYSTTVPTNAGDYTVRAAIAATNDYKEASATAEFSIAKAASSITINPTANSLTYTGNAQSLVTAGSDITGGTLQYTLGENVTTSPETGYSETIPTGDNAGSYYVWYKVVGDGNHNDTTPACVSVVVNNAALTNVSVTQNGTLTYTGEAQTPQVTTAATAVNNQPVTFTYSKTQDGEYGDMPTVTNVSDGGTFYYKASAPNHNDKTGNFAVTVNKATPGEVTAPTPEAVTYDPTKTLANVELPEGWAWVTDTSVPTVSNEGYAAALTVDDANYNYTSVEGYDNTTNKVTRTVTLTVNKAEVTAPTLDSKTYNAQNQTATVPESTLYSVTTNNGGTGVGNYDVVLTLTDTNNYKWTDSEEATKTLTFQITKATAPAVTVPTPEAVTYDPAKTLANVALTGGWAWVDSTTVPTVGNSGYQAALTVDDANYDYTGVDGYNSTDHKVTRTVSLTVNKADNPLTYAETQTVGKDFNTVSQTATLAGASSGQGDVSYAISSQKNSSNSDVSHFSLDGTTLTLAANTPAGIYTVVVTATAAGNDYYNSGTKDSTVTVTVNKTNYTGTMTASATLHAFSGRTVEVTLPELPAGASYGSVTNNNSALFTVSAVESGKVTVTAAKNFDKSTEADEKTFTVSVTGADNYNNYSVTVTITPTFYVALTEANKPTISVTRDGNVVTEGAPRVDDVLTANTTATDLTYQWYRGDVAIADATSATYTAVAADVGKTIKVTVTQTKKEDGTDYVEGVTKPVQTSAPTTEVAKKQRSGLTITNGSLGYTYSSGTVPAITASDAGQPPVIYYSTGRFTVDMIGTNSTVKAWSDDQSNTSINAGEYYVAAYYPETDEYEAFLTPFEMLTVAKGTRLAPSKVVSVDGDKMTATLADADKNKALEYAVDSTETSAWTLVKAENGVFPLGALSATSHTIYLRQQADENYLVTAASDGFTFSLTNKSVSYNANGGTGAPATQVSTSAITVSSVRPTRNGYTFDGWYTAATGGDAAAASYDSSITLYAHWTANNYTVKFNANGGTGTMTNQSFTYDAEATPLTANGFTAPTGKHFAGWATSANGAALYSNKQSVKNLTAEAGGTVNLYAVWAENVYNVSITVKSGDTGNNVMLKLMRGNTELAEKSSISMTNGTSEPQTFVGIPSGTYNVVATQGTKTMTVAVILTNVDHSAEITMPTTNTNSTLTVAEDARPVVVDGLAAEAESKAQDVSTTVTVAMSVTKQEEQELSATADEEARETQAAIESIKEEIGEPSSNQTREVEYMNIDLTKRVTPSGGSATDTKLTETTNVITVMIPYDMTGKSASALELFRYHNGEAQKLTKLDVKPTTLQDLTYYLLDNFIYLYTNQFSTYAISYTETTSSHSYSSGGSAASYAPTVSDSANGTVSISPKSASSGTKVTITAKPNEGYEVDTVTVTDANGKAVSVTKVNDMTYSFTQPGSKVKVDVTFKAASASDVLAQFTDVDTSSWYADAVRWAVENGVMNGVGDNRFNPNGNTSRAMIVTMLWRMEGSPAYVGASEFSDVDGDTWYTEAVRWASTEGIVTGYENPDDAGMIFNPNGAVTREQLATMLYRYAQYKKADVSASASLSSYGDAASVSSWAASAMQWAVGSGIINGIDGNLVPVGNATRAQVATMLMRYSTAK